MPKLQDSEKQLTAVFSKGTADKLDKYAKKDECSVAAILRAAVREYIRNREAR